MRPLLSQTEPTAHERPALHSWPKFNIAYDSSINYCVASCVICIDIIDINLLVSVFLKKPTALMVSREMNAHAFVDM